MENKNNELPFDIEDQKNDVKFDSYQGDYDFDNEEEIIGTEETGIAGLSQEEYNDPNQIRVTISDADAPVVVLFGPPACGKTMTLVRLARYLNKNGYNIAPIRTFRPNADKNYEEICKKENFNSMINSADAANSTANVSFMLIEVIKDGKRLCQILEAPGEYYFNPNKPTDPFPTYVNQIIHGNNRKLWAIMVEPDWKDQEDRNNYVQRIKDLSLQMSRRDKVLFVFNKIDKTNFVRSRGVVNIPQARNQIKNLYPGIFEQFRNQNPITRLWKDYLCGFAPFQTGTYTTTTRRDGKGNTVMSYQEGPDEYPRMLWNEIRKSITG